MKIPYRLVNVQSRPLYFIFQPSEAFRFATDKRSSYVFSNRFASHVLKQKQFLSIAKARNWDCGIAGTWDCNPEVRIQFPAYEIYAELQIALVGDEDTVDENSVFAFVTTDQIRFYRQLDDSLIPLQELPPILLSEVMRDVDLFVSVCSISNNPHCSDGGAQNKYKSYWYTFNYGELSALGLIRKDHIECILPSLEFASKCSVDDKYLIVRGSLHHYYIHFGSGRVIMEPEVEYMRIPPDILIKRKQVISFLLIDGDKTLPRILSTAMLLADNDKITEKAILPYLCPK